MKKMSAVLVMSFGMAIAPMAMAPAAQAGVCGQGAARYFVEENCSAELFPNYHPIVSQHHPYFPGETPCYTAEGVAYYTPGGHPC